VKPKIEKSLLAISEPAFLGNKFKENYKSTQVSLYDILAKDLAVVGYFRLLPPSAHLDKSEKLRPVTVDKNGFAWDPWQSLKVDYLLKTGFFFEGGQMVVEAYLYQVSKAQNVFATRYRGPVSSLRSLAHSAADDVVYHVSGQRSFLTKKIAFVAAPPGKTTRELFVADWDGENREQLTQHNTIVLSPAWSPDGKKVAYTAYLQRAISKMRNADLMVLDLETRKAKMTSYRKGINSGAYFDSLSSLYLTISTDSNPDIYRVDLEGNILTRVTNGPLGAINVEPALSPNKELLAFSSDRSGRPMIFISEPDGSNPRRLTFAGSFNAAPSWFPDSKHLAFAGWIDKAFDIYTIDIQGAEIRRITKANKPNGKQASHENPAVSPDGRVILYTSNRTGKNQLYMSLADGSEEWAITNDRWEYYQPKWAP
jgi:TolB protein